MKKTILFSLLSVVTAMSAPALAAWCEAYTTCADGQQIWCRSSGGSCTWQENDGVDVTCVGYSLPGYQGAYETSTSTCPLYPHPR